jgi:PAP2 superfamily protein
MRLHQSLTFPFYFVLFSVLSIGAAYAQFREEPSRLERTAEHITSGISEMVGWYDIPVAAIFFTKSYYLYSNPDDKPIVVTPLKFENDLATSVGVRGSESLGSLDPNYFPQMILITRTAFTLGSDLLSEKGSSKKAYKHAFALYKTMAYTEVATNLTKGIVRKDRPDYSDTKSFFSGHTSLTFAMSSFVQRELDDAIVNWQDLTDSPDLRTTLRVASFSVLYGWAAYVGYSRMRDNKHYLVDVLLGATIGTVLGNFVYDSYLDDGDTILKSVSVTNLDGIPGLGFSLKF